MVNSDIVVNADQIANTSGYISVDTSHEGWAGSVRVHAMDVVQTNNQFDGFLSASWDIYHPPSFKCPSYNSYGSYYPSYCAIYACPGQTIVASGCDKGACYGDQYLILYDSSGYYVAGDDNSCGLCSKLTYVVQGQSCQQFSLYESCANWNYCGGTITVTVSNASDASSASFAMSSTVSLLSDELWNVMGDASYGHHKYHIMATESVSSFLMKGDGGYGGNWQKW